METLYDILLKGVKGKFFLHIDKEFESVGIQIQNIKHFEWPNNQYFFVGKDISGYDSSIPFSNIKQFKIVSEDYFNQIAEKYRKIREENYKQTVKYHLLSNNKANLSESDKPFESIEDYRQYMRSFGYGD